MLTARQIRNIEDYRLTFRQPPGCQLANCSVVVGIDTNTGDPTVLDIAMQGVAGGWLAVGFSPSQSMVSLPCAKWEATSKSLWVCGQRQ